MVRRTATGARAVKPGLGEPSEEKLKTKHHGTYRMATSSRGTPDKGPSHAWLGFPVHLDHEFLSVVFYTFIVPKRNTTFLQLSLLTAIDGI